VIQLAGLALAAIGIVASLFQHRPFQLLLDIAWWKGAIHGGLVAFFGTTALFLILRLYCERDKPMNYLRALFAFLALFLFGAGATNPQFFQQVLHPQAAPQKEDEGHKRRRLLPRRLTGDLHGQPIYGIAQRGGLVSPDGKEEVNCDLPRHLHLKNKGGSDGAGLCVFCSLNHASYWQHVHVTEDIFKFMWTRPGGGYPGKVDAVIAAMAKAKAVEVPRYVQIENKDIEILKLACKTGRMPGVTYCFSPTGRYNGASYIAHMVNVVHATENWVAVLDNNYPGELEWMDPTTFRSVYTNRGKSNGWCVIFLDNGPPAPPKN
jgi:hypothetical protein